MEYKLGIASAMAVSGRPVVLRSHVCAEVHGVGGARSCVHIPVPVSNAHTSSIDTQNGSSSSITGVSADDDDPVVGRVIDDVVTDPVMWTCPDP